MGAIFYVVPGLLVLGALLAVMIRVRTIRSLDAFHVPRELPPAEVEREAAELLDGRADFEDLGFEPPVYVRLPASPPMYAALYPHRNGEMYGAAMRVGGKGRIELVSRFEGEVTLTTGDAPSAGGHPPAPNGLTQVFPGAGLDELKEHHERGVSFIEGRGFRTLPLRSDEGIREFQRRWIEELEGWMALPFWPARMAWWSLRRPGLSQTRLPVAEQVERGFPTPLEEASRG